MNRDEALAIVKPQLRTTRFEHTVRVTDTALELAKRFGGNLEKAELASIFHDYAKYRNIHEMKRWIITEALPKDLLQYHHELWHGPVGALLVEREVGISDSEVLSAIRWHTAGKANMSQLDKIVFLADYMEPGRDFPGVDEVREVAHNNLEKACWLATKNTIMHLMKKGQSIYPDTFHCYNSLLHDIMENTEGNHE
ncbi:bis(5'-nucleosyl)-tetraphosphatase (symmetrical) YqeK [Radiobacillus kanasensis]|uniref:bis(5'-nucleosyl)-tetraphosphatase (symmetrical) YqeK n=1 Tax=Radiobacillus kanasensis TaxID=2844358 RepID=UPI001E42BA83|nr:bis(5'-nucleosyl)-tetraphosphatase (symmetrical) YqeK [Radiobacillus kanasensis]UFT97842.1 bis(5'-nucleosyl)-tetraphosphatase (symmetrical) YqeK [Radiobacillus kanasensis]